jgi:hypothetical protein
MPASKVSELSLSESKSSLFSFDHMKKLEKTFLDKNEHILRYSAMDFKCILNNIIHLRQHSDVLIEASPRLKNCVKSSLTSLLYAYIRSWRLGERLIRLWGKFEHTKTLSKSNHNLTLRIYHQKLYLRNFQGIESWTILYWPCL